MTTETKPRRTRSRTSTTSSRSAGSGARRDSPAQDSLDGFAAFCGLLSLEDGSRFELHDFQRRMLGDFFAGATETVVLVSKKNGKSTLLSALALHHLLVTPDAECVIAAASRDQAQILLGQAQGFIKRSTGLAQRLQVKQREIVRRDGRGRIRVLASDVDTADGVIPTLALVDELHRHKSADLYGVFRDGLGPRAGRMITISTAGDDEDSPLGLMRQAASKLPTVERDDKYRYCRSTDGSYVLHEWALAPDDDRSDMALVKQANPAPWQTIESLRRRFESPSMTPWQWARFACGVWLRGEGLWLDDRSGWDKGAREGGQIPAGEPIVIGIDPAWHFDTCAVIALHRRDEGERRRVFAQPVAILKPDQGGSVPVWRVREMVLDSCEHWRVLAVGYDRNRGFEQLAQELADEHRLNMVAVPMSGAVWAPLTAEMRGAIVQGDVEHPADPEFTRHVLSGEVKESPQGPRLHGRTKEKVDGLMAMGIAWRVLFGEELRPAAPPRLINLSEV